MLGSEIVFPRASAIGYHRFYVIRQSVETVRRELTDVSFPYESRCGKMAKCDCAGVRHFPANAFSSFARSSFVICHNSCVTHCSPGGVLRPFGEKLCRCYLPGESVLVRKPSALHFLPAASGEFLPVIIDLLLRVAVDHERDGFGELELPRKLSGFKAVNSCPSSSNETVMTWPFFSGNSSPV